MNPVDGDDGVDVPDTPDRLFKRMINERSGDKEERHGSHIPFHLVQNFSEKGTEIQPLVVESGSRKLSIPAKKYTGSFTNTLRPLNPAAPSMASSPSFKNNPRSMAIDNGSRRQPSHPPKCASSSSNSLHPINSAGFSMASSFSSKSPLLFRKKAPTDQRDDSSHTQHLQIEKPSFSYKSHSSFQDRAFVDLTEMSLHSPEHGNTLPGGMPGSGRSECSRRSNGASSFKDLLRSTSRSGAGEGTDNMTEVISSNGYGQCSEFVGNARNKPGDDGSLHHESIVSPRVNKQKRLVRNGCISPNNIAKVAGKINNFCAPDSNDAITSGGPSAPLDIKEFVSEGHNSRIRKGKGVIMYPCASKDPEIKNKNLPSRSSSNFSGKAKETSDYVRGSGEHIEESGEWRSTHNRELCSSSTGEEQFVKREIDVPRYASQHNEKRMTKREKGSGVATDDDDSKVPNLFSSDHVSSLPLRQAMPLPRARLGQLNRYPPSANTLIKRQKQGSTLSYSGESSTPVSDDSEVVILSSSIGPSNSGSTSRDVANLHQTIDVDDFKPNTQDEVARAKQVEADELLARELQEQLYNDLPVLGVDTHIATVLQHQDNSNHPLSNSGSLLSNLRRQSQSRSSSNISRRGSQGRASTLGRISRQRGRFPGQPRTLLPSRGRTSLFPANMDVEMRMHILGTLEAFSDMEVGAGNLIAHRDFNENDYETLLALDENNDHGGASVHQINGLPQSTVQSDNFDEVCAICLETPTIGDTIRHLPCLHKFHKDCIDPWLRRRTLCPVCKSAIT
ncbi:uncharacterized protein [Henckelia pumila]|uniref:uncharacterized protein isoform X2 n=1 Tax=Henckelia pumila TaxID=405737 RepID=UPI003C6E44BE